MDDREIAETRDMLRVLQTSAMGWHRQRGRFRHDLVGGVYKAQDFTKRGLPAAPSIETRLGADRQAVAYWRATASGWVLGLGLVADGEHFQEYLFAGAQPPAGLPEEAGSGGGRFSTPRPTGPET